MKSKHYSSIQDLSIRSDSGDDSSTTLEGYAAVFDVTTQIRAFGGSYLESLAPGAFKRTLSEGADVRALIDHDPSKIIGRNKANTLRLSEDSKGLKVEIDVPDTQLGRDILTSVKRGDVSGMSFGFYIVDSDWNTRDGQDHLYISDVDLFDVSVVTFPAYPEGTEIGVRSQESKNSIYKEYIQNRDNGILIEKESRARKLRLIQLS